MRIDLTARARSALQRNDHGNFTTPSLGRHPHQMRKFGFEFLASLDVLVFLNESYIPAKVESEFDTNRKRPGKCVGLQPSVTESHFSKNVRRHESS